MYMKTIILSALLCSTIVSLTNCTANPIGNQPQVIGGRAVIPPRYLSIPKWQSCVSTQQMGTYTAYCLPQMKADDCPRRSWHELKALTGKDALPPCR